MRIVNIVGARPNFMKMAPLMREMRRHSNLQPILVHTGQHYDVAMAGRIFADLGMHAPDVSLDVGSGSHAVQTAEVMKRLEPVLERERPDVVLVVGDVNSTLAAAVTAAKMHIPVAHVEAGLRSFDRTMPEEINRVLTDAVSDYLFVSEESGLRNLAAEGVDGRKVFFVGNVMIDSLEASRRLWGQSSVREQLSLAEGRYGVMTLHRPSNVDHPETLRNLLGAVSRIALDLPIVFPVHPRTRRRLEETTELKALLHLGQAPVGEKGIYCIEPLGYLDFMSLVAGSELILTDSGGIQEETTALGIPCLTLRENTERPVTITHGTNSLVGCEPARIIEEANRALSRTSRKSSSPPLWDGKTSERIVKVLLNTESTSSQFRDQSIGSKA